jgi:putative effector of murein hydrolase LrgA (UPF0299 family)
LLWARPYLLCGSIKSSNNRHLAGPNNERTGSFCRRLCHGAGWHAATLFLLFVPKMSQALTFLATIEIDDHGMKTLAVISILALLTISGAAYTDQLLTGDQQAAQGTN